MSAVQDTDSAGTKFEGALINAAIFVVIVGVMTFVLFLLFKYGVSFSTCPILIAHRNALQNSTIRDRVDISKYARSIGNSQLPEDHTAGRSIPLVKEHHNFV